MASPAIVQADAIGLAMGRNRSLLPAFARRIGWCHGCIRRACGLRGAMSSAEAVAAPGRARGRMIGETGVWVVVFGDLAMFGLFFLTYAVYYRADPAAFAAQQALLDRPIGLVNTLLLLTSSLFVALGVDAARHGSRAAARWFLLGILGGLGFVALKSFEWSQKFASGISISSGDFFMFFFTLSGIHLAHVLAGLVVLAVMAKHVARAPDGANLPLLESGAAFWHLVDLLWVFLFALLYLVRL